MLDIIFQNETTRGTDDVVFTIKNHCNQYLWMGAQVSIFQINKSDIMV